MAWKFRQEFQSRLGLVFDHFSTIYHSFPGRITAETFKSQITGVIDIWEDWIVFPPEFTQHLRRRIEGHVELPKATTAQDDGGETPMDMESDVDGQSLDDIDGEPLENIDGEPMDDLDGTPLDDDIDGAPMEDDIDGAPLDGNIDGAPMRDIDEEPII